jgi:hypothetical protein
MKGIFSPAGANELQNSENDKGNIAGFWRGLWHGLIAPFAFLISLFKEDVGVYETHNNGKWYNFGFILGLMLVFGGNRGGGKKFTIPRSE